MSWLVGLSPFTHLCVLCCSLSSPPFPSCMQYPRKQSVCVLAPLLCPLSSHPPLPLLSYRSARRISLVAGFLLVFLFIIVSSSWCSWGSLSSSSSLNRRVVVLLSGPSAGRGDDGGRAAAAVRGGLALSPLPDRRAGGGLPRRAADTVLPRPLTRCCAAVLLCSARGRWASGSRASATRPRASSRPRRSSLAYG